MQADKLDTIRQGLATWLADIVDGAEGVTVSPLSVPEGMGWSVEIAFFELRYREHGEQRQRQRDCVLRRDVQQTPLILGTDLGLQTDVMRALSSHSNLPVPEVLGVETDPAVLGSPFMVMERMRGRCVQQTPNYNIAGWVSELPQERRAEVWYNGMDALAALHRVDWRDGFEFLTEPGATGSSLEQYLSWVEKWYQWATAGRPIPVVDAALEYVRANVPDTRHTSVLWGDPTPANTMFGDDLSVSGMLDWELAALGPPEVDLAWWLFFDELFSTGLGYDRLAGLPDRQQCIERYEAGLGRKLDDLHFYDVLTGLKMSIITIRAVDRAAHAGVIPLENDAIRGNPSTQYLARRLGIDVPEIGPDFMHYISGVTPMSE